MKKFDYDFGLVVRSKLIDLGLEKVNTCSETYSLSHSERILSIQNSLKQIYNIVGVQNTPEIDDLAKTIYERYSGQSYRNFPRLIKPIKLDGSKNGIGNYSWQATIVDESDWTKTVNVVLQNITCNTGEYTSNPKNIEALFNFFTQRPVFSLDVVCRQVEEAMKLLYTNDVEIKFNVLPL